MPLGVKYDKPVDIAIDSTGIKAFNRGSGRSGHITGSSNRWLRRNMIECARAAVRNDQHLEGFYLKLKRKRGGEEGADSGGQEDGHLCVLDAEKEFNLRRAVTLGMNMRSILVC